MNKELIENLESAINIGHPEYVEQYKEITRDHFHYCKPGSVNNWTHPESPPTLTSLVLACKILDPSRILDLGTGLSGFIFKKYFSKKDVVCVDDSFSWLQRLFAYLDSTGLNHDGLYWLDDGQFRDINALCKKTLIDMIANPHEVATKVSTPVDNLEHDTVAYRFYEPIVCYQHCDVTEFSVPDSGNPNIDHVKCLESHATEKLIYQTTREGGFIRLHDPNQKTFSSLGKFEFIHYDLGGMYTRGAYLRVAIDMLDRTRDSMMYIDDLHKGEILYENKTYRKIVEDIIALQGGVWLDCEKAIAGWGGKHRGGLVYFPPVVESDL